jgi:hypothetical protein
MSLQSNDRPSIATERSNSAGTELQYDRIVVAWNDCGAFWIRSRLKAYSRITGLMETADRWRVVYVRSKMFNERVLKKVRWVIDWKCRGAQVEMMSQGAESGLA